MTLFVGIVGVVALPDLLSCIARLRCRHGQIFSTQDEEISEKGMYIVHRIHKLNQ